MAKIKPFVCIRPAKAVASRVAALPYDVYSRKEAKEAARKDPLSFLNIDRPESQFPDTYDMYADAVYEKAKELLENQIQDGVYEIDTEETYYIYRLTMNEHTQTGLVGCSSVDDYVNGIIKKHENTREEKELDRIRHVDITNAQTGPIFLTYRANDKVRAIIEDETKKEPLYDFVSEDGISHTVWKIEGRERTKEIEEAFQEIPFTYIADGHHRAASAVKVGLKRREQRQNQVRKEQPSDSFLSVLFSDEELQILPYHRVVRDLNGLSKEEFLKAVSENFVVEDRGEVPVEPDKKGRFGMYLDGNWYHLTAKDTILSHDPVKGLDVSVLQEALLNPILGIEDPRTDKRIDFIGGIRGWRELERRVKTDMAVAFSMYPTSMEELLTVADAGRLMPPKSTWFEPKLRSGLFIHPLENESIIR